MKTALIPSLTAARKSSRQAEHGTTLLELLIAVALFTIISGMAFTLLNQQQNVALGSSGRVGLNLALRSTTSMLQMDMANAGQYYFQAQNVSTGALGVTVLNRVVTAPVSGTGCYTAPTPPSTIGTYGPNCFDQLSVIAVDPSYPVMNATDSTAGTSGTNCSYTSTTGTGTTTIYGRAATLMPNTPNNTTASPVALTAATVISNGYFHVGDQLLLVNYTGPIYTSAILTALPVVSGSTVEFTINQTSSTGSNTLAHDPLNISACSGATTCPPTATPTSPPLGIKFCGQDWILKLAPVTYQVCSGPGSPTTPYACDQSTSSPDIIDPKLMRTQNGVTSTVMEQIIGFKVGGSVWNLPDPATTPASDVTYYNYDSSSYVNPGTQATNPYNFSLLHSIRISLIGRTTPAPTDNYVYRNNFDQGLYQVQGTALVVNPRNMNPEAMP